jgi:hypothetical protein
MTLVTGVTKNGTCFLTINGSKVRRKTLNQGAKVVG